MTASHVKIWLLVLLAIGAARWLTGCPPQQDVAHEPNWAPDRTVYVEMKWEWESVKAAAYGPFPQPPENSTGRLTVGYWHTVERVMPFGSARIHLTIDRVAYSIDSTQRNRWYDSDVQELPAQAAPLRAVLEPLVGTKLILEVDPNGRVTQLAGVAAIRAQVEATAPDPDYLALIEELLTDQWHREAWQDYYGAYAFTSINQGSSWNSVRGEVRDSATYRYTIDAVDTVSEEPTIRASIQVGALGGSSVSEQAVTTGSGTTVFDIRRGEIVFLTETGRQQTTTHLPDERTGTMVETRTETDRRRTITVLSEAERRAQRSAQR